MSWLIDRLKGAAEGVVEDTIKSGVKLGLVALIVLLLPVIAVGIAAFRDNLAWGLVGALAFIVVVLLVRIRWLKRVTPSDRRALHELRKDMAIAGYFAQLFRGVLDTIQKVHSGVIPTSEERLVEHGILEPARELLARSAGEVRLSVLVPSGQRWKMIYAAGHSLEGKQRFDLPIADSLARIAYESGETQYFEDVYEHPRFRPHARATREYHSMISVAIKQGESIVGVLNAVAVDADAFSEVDQFVVELLGAIVEVALAVALAEGEEDTR